MTSQRAKSIFGWLIGSLLLCYAAFYNGYALVYPDTGTYLYSGFQGNVPIDRPLAYGLFVRHSSLSTSLWFSVIAQGMLLGSLIFLFIKYLMPSRQHPLWSVAIITGLVLFSGVSTRTSQMMPDIFASMPALGLALLLFGNAVPLGTRIYLATITVLSLMMHSSHPMIYGLTMGLLSVVWGIQWVRTRQLPLSWRNWGLAWGLVILAWLAIPTLHVLYGGAFKANRASHIFMMGQLNSMGLLGHYLKRHCDDEDYFLCPYQDALPLDYLWNPQSPIYKTGGWEAQDPAVYQHLIRDILTEPRYFKLFVIKVFMGTFHQFFHFHTANTPPQHSKSLAYQAIDGYFPYEVYALILARQWEAANLTYESLNVRERMLMFACLLGVVALMLQPGWVRQVPTPLVWTLVVIMVMLLVNAAICGGLSNGNMRYQNRVAWTLPLIMSLIVLSQRHRVVRWWAGLSRPADTGDH
jgi:small basic protein